MSVVNIIKKNYQNLTFNGHGTCIVKFYNICFLQPSVLSFMSTPTRCFKLSHGRLENDEECFQPYEKPQNTTTAKKKFSKGPKVRIIDERGIDSLMYLPDAEKYAMRNNLKLVQMESNKKEKLKYKLVKISELFQEKTKSKSKDLKTFLMKDVITDHDLQIKIKSMLKYLERGLKIGCLIEKVDKANRLDEIFNKIKESELKDYKITCNKSLKKLNIYIEKESSKAAGSDTIHSKESDKPV